MRLLGVDVGTRRVGLAVSDPSRTLARPLDTLHVASTAAAVARLVDVVNRLRAEEDGLDAIVVGMPRALDGAANDATERVAAFIALLRTKTSVTVVTEDERLSSREAESRLAVRERDWRARKAKLDAAAAAIILQDYLDRTA
jgi:putative Holliday junction resolvase